MAQLHQPPPLARSSKAERSPDKRGTTEHYRPGQPFWRANSGSRKPVFARRGSGGEDCRAVARIQRAKAGENANYELRPRPAAIAGSSNRRTADFGPANACATHAPAAIRRASLAHGLRPVLSCSAGHFHSLQAQAAMQRFGSLRSVFRTPPSAAPSPLRSVVNRTGRRKPGAEIHFSLMQKKNTHPPALRWSCGEARSAAAASKLQRRRATLG